MRTAGKKAAATIALAGLAFWAGPASGQARFDTGEVYYGGSAGGIPVVCGTVTYVVPQAGSALEPVNARSGNPDAEAGAYPARLYTFPADFWRAPTVLRLYWTAHRCGHFFVGVDEAAADCWAVRAGRDQGWLGPDGFTALYRILQGNGGNMSHAAEPRRLRLMEQCFAH